MRLLCVLNGGDDHPSTRFRVLQHLPILRTGGIEPDLMVAKRDAGYGLLDLRRRARAADAVLIQKKLFAAFKVALLPRTVPILYDFDDALFEISPDEEERFGPERAARRMRSRRTRLLVTARRARVVIAGNHFLAAWARATGARVEILPTGVDLAPFPAPALDEAAARRRARRDDHRIGWIGSRPSLRYLAALAGPLREVCARFPGARLVQVCNEFIDLPGVPVEKRPWSAATEARDLLDLDIGLMPIDDRPFARGKCGLKILQYQAAGVPVVCSPVGANVEIVRDGETGLHAGDDRTWTAAIARLLTDRDAAARIGAAGRERVATTYAAPVIGRRLIEIVRSMVNARAGLGAGGDDCAAPSGADLPGEEGERDQKTEHHERLLVPDHLPERPALAAASGVGAQ
jgi:glycosyltransferase involved in cell wall biosynthesis